MIQPDAFEGELEELSLGFGVDFAAPEDGEVVEHLFGPAQVR